jgi:hypothetical protein
MHQVFLATLCCSLKMATATSARATKLEQLKALVGEEALAEARAGGAQVVEARALHDALTGGTYKWRISFEQLDEWLSKIYQDPTRAGERARVDDDGGGDESHAGDECIRV